MSQIPIAFRSNPGKYQFLGTSRLINAYAENMGKDTKDPLPVLPCPGLTEFTTVTDTPCRGTIYLPDIDVAYSVHSSGVFKVLSDGTVTRLGTIPGSDVVQISRNQAAEPQITIQCATGVFYVQSDVVLRVTDEDLPTPVITQDQVAGFTAYGLADRRVFLSSINETQTVDGLDFQTAEQSADPLKRVKGNGGDLVVFKQRSIEFWRNTGNADFPFEPLPSVPTRGILSGNAAIEIDNTVVFPTNDFLVCRLSGYAPKRISTNYIERTLESEGNPDGIIGFAHFSEGHSFATLTGTDWSRAYDASTGVWHDRESYNLTYWRACFPFRAWGKWIFGDKLTGKLLFLDDTAFTEDDGPLVWGMDSPTLMSPTGAGRIDWIRISFLTGHGRVTDTTDPGFEPKIMLAWSVDGGNTWSGNRHLPLGKSGKYKTRVHAYRLGRFADKGVAFRIRVSDPVPRAISEINVGITPMVQR